MRPQGLCALLLCASAAAQTAPPLPSALDTITASRLRGHVSFLASDLLEGRDTPSRGLDIAAEYLASQFRAFDLEPLGDNGYFQTINWTIIESAPTGITLSLDGAPVDPKHFRVTAGANAIDAEGDIAEVKSSETAGRIVRLADANRATVMDALRILRNSPPQVVLIPDERDTLNASGAFQPRALVTPYDPPRGNYVYVLCTGPAAALAKSAKTAQFHMPAGTTTPARLWNVAALLRGSDPTLAATAVIVSAHYDHEGLRPNNPRDQVMNGANDDASGVAAMLETARALAALPQRPKRSILFLGLVGEEKGLLGSKHYARNPLWPLDKTVANLNLEMFGRTEEGEYTRAGQMTITGSGFSTVTDFVRQATLDLGGIYFINRQGNEEFFARSDNFPLAMAGIPAHSLTPGFSFQDYHAPGDEWPKLDYDNMQRATRIAALAALRLAENDTAPEWDLNDPTAKKFAERRKPAAAPPPASTQPNLPQ
ncbi:MAG: M20/M25/M40 family metallo-hydrolase [Acidobacteria bacterium]|nr:M20/M25/M40 family metallo-hydrolase [Acidobacteriota bacterium]